MVNCIYPSTWTNYCRPTIIRSSLYFCVGMSLLMVVMLVIVNDLTAYTLSKQNIEKQPEGCLGFIQLVELSKPVYAYYQ